MKKKILLLISIVFIVNSSFSSAIVNSMNDVLIFSVMERVRD